MQGRRDQDGVDAGVGGIGNVALPANAATGDQLDPAVTTADPPAQIQRGWSTAGADPRQIEHDQANHARVDHRIGDLNRCGFGPGVRMGHRNALFQVQAEDQRLVAHGLHQLPHEFGAGHGLEPGDDRLDSPFDKFTGSIDVTETRDESDPCWSSDPMATRDVSEDPEATRDPTTRPFYY